MDIDGLLIFLSKRYGNGKFITDEHAIVLEAALKAAETRRAWHKLTPPHKIYDSDGEEWNAAIDKCKKAEAAYEKEIERGR